MGKRQGGTPFSIGALSASLVRASFQRGHQGGMEGGNHVVWRLALTPSLF